MAITNAGGVATSSANASASSTLTITASLDNFLTNRWAIAVVTSDNLSSSDGETNTHQSISHGSLTWTKVKEWTNANGGAGNGVTTSVWFTQNDTGGNLGSGNTIGTVNFSSSVTRKCCGVHAFNATALYVHQTVTNDGDASSGFGSTSTSGLSSQEYLHFAAYGKEVNSTASLTLSSGFDGSIANQRSDATADAIIVRGEFDIATTTGVTANPTFTPSGDWSTILVAFAETAPSGGGSFKAAWAINSTVTIR
jgi:hypothetical protein